MTQTLHFKKNTLFILCVLFSTTVINNLQAQTQMGSVNFTAVSSSFDENTMDTSCYSSMTYDLSVLAINVDPQADIEIMVAGGTATEGIDYSLSNTSFTVSGTGETTFQIEIIDDEEVEGNETIELTFMFDNTAQNSTVTIVDNDAIPVLGSSTVELLNETFDVSTLPNGWTESQLLDTGLNYWHFNGTGTAAGTAYITFDPHTTPIYDQVGANPAEMDSSSNALLLSPELDAQGYGSVSVSFDWMAGGESNAQDMLPDDIFDYGQFEYTTDGGSSFVAIEQFLGTDASYGAVPDSGTFTMEIPELANQTFQIAFRWISDQLIAQTFSFTVDNVLVTAEPIQVETVLDASKSAVIRANTDIYYISDENNAIIGRVENASEDMGCVTITVASGGSSTVVSNSEEGFNRTSKVIQVIPNSRGGSTPIFDLTLYMTADELSNFTNVSNLEMLKVEGTNIDDTTNSPFVITGSVFEDNLSTDGYASFKGRFEGYGVFAIVEDATQSVNDFNTNTIAVFPNSVSQGQTFTVQSKSDLEITTISIYTINGQRVNTIANPLNSKTVEISTATLANGMYFVSINNDATKTLKVIVR